MNWMGGYRKPNRLSKKDKEKQDQFFARRRLEKHLTENRNPSGTTPSIPSPADIFFASKMGSALPLAGSSGISPPDPLTKWCAVLQEDFKTNSNSNYRGEREKTNVGFNNKIPAYSCSLQNQNMIEPYPGSNQPKKQLTGNFSNYDDKMDKFKIPDPPTQLNFNFNETPKGDRNSTSNRPEGFQTFELDPPTQFNFNFNETPKGDRNSTSNRPEGFQTFEIDDQREYFKTNSNSNYRGEREKTNVGFNNKIPAYSCSLQNQNMIEPYPGSNQPKKQLAGNFSNYDDKMDKFKITDPLTQFNFNETPKGDRNSTSNRPEGFQTFEIDDQREENSELSYVSCVENEQGSVFIRKEWDEENPFIEEVVEMRRKIPTSKILTLPSSASSKGGYQPYTRNLESNKRSSPFQMGNVRNSGNEGLSSLSRKMPIKRSSPIQNSRSSQKKNEVCKSNVKDVYFSNENSKNLQKKEIKTAVNELEDSLATQYQEWLMTKIMDELYFELPSELKKSLEYTRESNVSRSVTQQSEVSGVSLRSRMKIVEITTTETSVQTDANSSQTMKEVSVQTSFESPKIKKDFAKVGTTVETMVQTDSNSSQMMKEVSVQTSFESPKIKKDFTETGIQYNEFEMASYFHPHKRICYSV